MSTAGALIVFGKFDWSSGNLTGAGTDSSEQGRLAWARVKGATENALMRLFKKSYMFRPGFMKKVSRTSVLEHYGIMTLMYGTVIPAPDIGRWWQ